MNGKQSTQYGKAIDLMDDYSMQSVPYFFLFDFECQKPIVLPLSDLPSDVWIDTPIYSNHQSLPSTEVIHLQPSPMSLDDYQVGYNKVVASINYGNSYLTNLTYATELINFGYDLETIYHSAVAKYKLKYQDEFIVFSPEPFVKIDKDQISTYPMKGTRKLSTLMDGKHLLDDPKEQAEHATIVDLMRNDLSQVSKSVKVDDYRYMQIIKSQTQELFQTSSNISGTLTETYQGKHGSILDQLLPAGSVSGAPKQSTLAIIENAEHGARGYYTGVFGVYDGHQMVSSVLIRYIEHLKGKYYFRSGGGITSRSKCIEEYHELLHKIYVPIH